MKLEKLEIKNFRCFVHETVDFNRYTALVGPNNCGKSTIFKAADVFFRSTQKTTPISKTDFTDPDKEMKISLTFSELPKAAEEEFSHYYRNGKLEFFIKAHLDNSSVVHASVHGSRAGIAEFASFFEAPNATAKKDAYRQIKENVFPDLPDLAKTAAVSVYEEAIKQFEAANPKKLTMIDSEDLAFGASGVAAKLRRYVDWVYIPAVKDAADEDQEAKNTAFGSLIARIIRAKVKVEEKLTAIRSAAHDTIKELIGDYKDEIKGLEKILDTEFRKITSAQAHVHLDWTEMSEADVTLNLPLIKSKFSDETFKGDITDFGHVLQRNYLITLVHVTAKMAADDQPSLILACEEPELYQHPPQARYLYSALKRLAETEQVLITTHSAYFISAKSFADIRVVSKRGAAHSKVTAWSVDQHRKMIAEAYDEKPIGEAASQATLEPFIRPELAEAFFCGKLVLVEGPEDKAILHTVLEHNGQLDDFLRAGCHIVGANGKPGLINMIAIAKGFETPFFVMFDADTDCKEADVKGTKLLNSKLAKLLGKQEADFSWPTADHFDHHIVVWKTNIQAAISSDFTTWYESVKKVCTDFGWRYDNLKKNPAVMAHSLETVLAAKHDLKCLNKATDQLMKWAVN